MNNNDKNYAEETKTSFYENYFNNDDYDVFRNDVGSFCTRKAIINKIKQTSGNILEIGTGISSLLEDVPQFNRFGLDISETTIAKTKDFFKRKGIPVALIVADAEQIPLESAFFDVIVSSHTLEHVENDAAVIKECARLLKPGGELIFFVPGRLNGTATKDEWINLGHYRSYNSARFLALEKHVADSLKLTTIIYPHKIHNLLWNRLKHIARWANYPIKKWIMRDNKTYEARPNYKKIILPALSKTLDFLDNFTQIKESNFCGAEFNVLARFEKK